MNNQQRLENISYLLFNKAYSYLSEDEKREVLQAWEHPFWYYNDRNIRNLKQGMKVVLNG